MAIGHTSAPWRNQNSHAIADRMIRVQAGKIYAEDTSIGATFLACRRQYDWSVSHRRLWQSLGR